MPEVLFNAAREIAFTVEGKAQTAGSKKAIPLIVNGALVLRDGRRIPGGVPVVMVVDDNEAKGKPWRADVQWAARNVFQDSLLTGPLAVTFAFTIERPKGHTTKTGKRSSKWIPYPIVKPDLLKLARAIEDALTGVVWRDDAQIVEERLIKRYGETAQVEIAIEEVA